MLRKLKTEHGYEGKLLKQIEADLKATNFLLWKVEDALGNMKPGPILVKASFAWRAKFM